MTQLESYREHLQQLHHRRVYFIIPSCLGLMVMLSLLDYILFPQLIKTFATIKIALFLFAGLLLAINHKDRKFRSPVTIGFFFYFVTSVSIIYMCQHTGGSSSPYYIGLLLTMTIYIALAPLTLAQSLFSCFLVVLTYGMTLLASHPFQQPFIMEMFNNIFFLTSIVFIISTQSWAETKLRKSELSLGNREKRTAEKLKFHAKKLENEVEKRTHEQALAESRYKMLFNQIVDDIVVITTRGLIIQANSSFEKRHTNGKSAVGLSLYEATLKRHHEKLKNALTMMAEKQKPLARLQICLQKSDGTISEAEINGNILRREEDFVGILLVIRDISIRKQMEETLRASLEMKKATEASAILALAKLSEFRDMTTDNHLERIREYCRVLADELAQNPELQEVMTPTYRDDIYHASILHDIGKVAVADNLLTRIDELTPPEEEELKKHTIIGGNVIREMETESGESPYLSMAKHIAYFHHERWDGHGYPYGLVGREIPLAARIMALADTYEEMTATSGEQGMGINHEDACNRIKESSGDHFDPLIVDAFFNCEREFNAIRKNYSESISTHSH